MCPPALEFHVLHLLQRVCCSGEFVLNHLENYRWQTVLFFHLLWYTMYPFWRERYEGSPYTSRVILILMTTRPCARARGLKDYVVNRQNSFQKNYFYSDKNLCVRRYYGCVTCVHKVQGWGEYFKLNLISRISLEIIHNNINFVFGLLSSADL